MYNLWIILNSWNFREIICLYHGRYDAYRSILNFSIFKMITDRTCLSTRSLVTTYTDTFKLSNHNTCTCRHSMWITLWISSYQRWTFFAVLPVCLIFIIQRRYEKQVFNSFIWNSYRSIKHTIWRRSNKEGRLVTITFEINTVSLAWVVMFSC